MRGKCVNASSYLLFLLTESCLRCSVLAERLHWRPRRNSSDEHYPLVRPLAGRGCRTGLRFAHFVSLSRRQNRVRTHCSGRESRDLVRPTRVHRAASSQRAAPCFPDIRIAAATICSLSPPPSCGRNSTCQAKDPVKSRYSRTIRLSNVRSGHESSFFTLSFWLRTVFTVKDELDT